MKCARCGRTFALAEGRIGDQYYCHPDDPALPDCYEIACHEQTWLRREVEVPEEMLLDQIRHLEKYRINATFKDHSLTRKDPS